jgi:hypothetical protein
LRPRIREKPSPAFTSLAVVLAQLLAGLWFVNVGIESGVKKPAYLHEPFPLHAFTARDLNQDDWSVSPFSPGTNLPPRGRSLFDSLVGDAQLPLPFDALLEALARRAQCQSALEGDYRRCFRAVFIPAGRSLQRAASLGEFFRYPRVVVAVDEDAAQATGAPLSKDRLYLAYHEKVRSIEVISYNEGAGRFEFQVVRDYANGATPRILYANRAMCTACHQNHGPIFSRQTWDETNANPDIARRLAREARDARNFPLDRGVTNARAVDDASDRANLYSAYQRLWQAGCGGNDAAGVRCRASALLAGIEYRVSGEKTFGRTSQAWQRDFEGAAAAAWRTHWPGGLKIPNADIPNRDASRLTAATEISHVSAPLDPLTPRGYSERWQWETDRYRVVQGVATFLSHDDVRLLRNLQAVRAAVARLAQREIAGGADLLAAAPFPRAKIMTALAHELGVAEARWCCAGETSSTPREDSMPSPREPTNTGAAQPLGVFHQHCGQCHEGAEPSPPNFLRGDARTVARNLDHCAERILYRLSMWDRPAAARAKSPMPPELAVHAFKPWPSAWAASAPLAEMKRDIARRAGKTFPEIAERRYETLRSCLPAN